MDPLTAINLAIAIGMSVVNGIKGTNNPAYASVLQSTQAGIVELQKARQEIITKAELESLRSSPKW